MLQMMLCTNDVYLMLYTDYVKLESNYTSLTNGSKVSVHIFQLHAVITYTYFGSDFPNLNIFYTFNGYH